MAIDPLLNHINASRQRIANLKRLDSADQKLLMRAVQELTDTLEEAMTIQEYVTDERERTSLEYEKAKEERRHYCQLFDTAPHAYMVTSRTGLIVEANEACRILLNFEKSFLPGLPLRIFVANEERKAFDECVRVSAGERRAGKYSFHFLPHNKPSFTAALTICPFGENFQLAWTIEDAGETEAHGPPLLTQEKKCFEDWITGKPVRWIGDSVGVTRTQAAEWVTEWERGIQHKWQPYILD